MIQKLVHIIKYYSNYILHPETIWMHHTVSNNNHNTFQDIYNDNQIHTQLLHELSLITNLSLEEIQTYIDMNSLYIITNETSTLKLQIKQLTQIINDSYLQQDMIDIINNTKKQQKQLKRLNTEYRIALLHLRKQHIYPDISLSKQNIINMYKQMRP